MRIISKFHDYYDTALSYGDDASLVYMRTTSNDKVIENKKHPLFNLIHSEMDKISSLYLDYYSDSGKNKVQLRIYPEFLYMCGKTHLIFKLEHDTTNNRIYYSSQDTLRNVEYFTNLDEALTRGTEITGIDFNTYTPKPQYSWYAGKYQFSKKEAYRKKVLDSIEAFEKSDKAPEVLFHYNIPIVHLMRDGSVTLNPCLLDLSFQKKMDPWTVFQEIDMYTGGVLKRVDAMTCDIADKDRITQHGFDKWSFRKLPEPKV